MTRGSTTVSLTNDLAGHLIGESYMDGGSEKVKITRSFAGDKPAGLNVYYKGQLILATANQYDPTNGMLSSISYSGYTATYQYLGSPTLITNITLSKDSKGLKIGRAFDAQGRLQLVDAQTFGFATNYSVTSFQYQYDLLNRRTNVTLGGASSISPSSWRHGYDTLGQVTNGWRYWSNGTEVAGQRFNYQFDDIGNRRLARSGGSSQMRESDYTVNALNQVVSRTVPAYVNLHGEATNTATVTINGQAPTIFTNNYWWKELTVSNSSYVAVTNQAIGMVGGQSVTGRVAGWVWVPPAAESFSYDDDGNLLSDGRWNLTWDAENRLVAAETKTCVAAEARRKLAFQYDYLGRRTRKTVWKWASSGYLLARDMVFIYDGGNLVAEVDAITEKVARKYLWGLDLSGSFQGAGGVGGLLLMDAGGLGVHYTVNDGNGNMTTLVNATNGTISAHYEYAPFAETIRATGPLAGINPIRFSSKYQDDETGWVYYLFRYYDPVNARWLSRDPIEEEGGLNLYGFISNDPPNGYDPDGLNEVIVSGGCNPNKHGWDSQGPIDTDVEWPARVARPVAGALGMDIAHDRNWQNFITAAEAEIKRRKGKLKPGEKIEWFVEINSYVAREAADGAPKWSYIQKIRDIATEHNIQIRWFGTKQGFLANINTAPPNDYSAPTGDKRKGVTKISRFTYFGHGTKGKLDFHYYDAVKPNSNSQSLTREDIKKGLILKDAFMNNAIGISCGCNSATKMDDAKGSLRDVWEAYFGFTFYGVNSRLDYSNPQNPKPSSGGQWQPATPP